MNRSHLHEDLSRAVINLRDAITGALHEVRLDVSKPQDISRKLLIDKSLAWKVSRSARAASVDETLGHMPGGIALGIFVDSMEKAGVQPRRLEALRSATAQFRDAVARHIGDRGTLELVLDALPSQGPDRLQISRKLAFRGNSGIWGIQARVRVNTVLLRPNAENPDLLDSVLLGGWEDFRRIRPDAPWQMFRRVSHPSPVAPPNAEAPLDPEEPVAGPHLLRKFCSENMPQIHVEQEGGATSYRLGASPIGKSGEFTFYFASQRAALGNRYSLEPDESAQFFSMISAPVEFLQFDFVLHRSISFQGEPKVTVHGRLTPTIEQKPDHDRLPIQPQVHDLGDGPPKFSTPLIPEYSRIMSSVFKLWGADPTQFRATRYVIEYPPFPSTVTVSVALPERPA
jgi:hypothetical protein